jgi:hypothetical protein
VGVKFCWALALVNLSFNSSEPPCPAQSSERANLLGAGGARERGGRSAGGHKERSRTASAVREGHFSKSTRSGAPPVTSVHRQTLRYTSPLKWPTRPTLNPSTRDSLSQFEKFVAKPEQRQSSSESPDPIQEAVGSRIVQQSNASSHHRKQESPDMNSISMA